MKKFLLPVVAVLGLASVAHADPRSIAINAAADLALSAAEMSDKVRNNCHCSVISDISDLLGDLADRAVDIEMVIRYQEKEDAAYEMRKLVSIAIRLRQLIAKIPSAVLRHDLKQSYLRSLNELGYNVDQMWVVVRAPQNIELELDGLETNATRSIVNQTW